MPSDAIVEGVSGAIGGCIATVATYPLQTVSCPPPSLFVSFHPYPYHHYHYQHHITQITTRQVTRVAAAPTATTTTTEEEKQPPPTTPPPPSISTIDELLRIIRTSGWSALFPGLGAALVGTTVSQGIYFYLYSLLRQAAVHRRQSKFTLQQQQQQGDARSAEVTIPESLLMASVAGAGNVLITNPIWMIATRMQAHQRRHHGPVVHTYGTSPGKGEGERVATPTATPGGPGPLAVAREVYHEYGIRGFWHGVSASLVMVINPTIQYALYEWLLGARQRVKRRQLGAVGALLPRPSAAEIFVLSAIAKAGATVLTYPLLTVKTRMMSARKSDTEMQYKSIGDAIAQIARKEGASGYYKGIRTKIVQSVLAAALLFMCKEKITDFTRDLLMGTAEAKVVVAAAAVLVERQQQQQWKK